MRPLPKLIPIPLKPSLAPEFALYHKLEQLLINTVRDWMTEESDDGTARWASGKSPIDMLCIRCSYRRYLESMQHKDTMYIRLLDSNKFSFHLTELSKRFWSDLSGREGLQAVTFIQRHYAYAQWRDSLTVSSRSRAISRRLQLFECDPNDEEGMEQQEFQITYQLCKILLNPRNKVYDMWTILRDEKDRQIGILAEEIDELESLIEGATETS